MEQKAGPNEKLSPIIARRITGFGKYFQLLEGSFNDVVGRTKEPVKIILQLK